MGDFREFRGIEGFEGSRLRVCKRVRTRALAPNARMPRRRDGSARRP